MDEYVLSLPSVQAERRVFGGAYFVRLIGIGLAILLSLASSRCRGRSAPPPDSTALGGSGGTIDGIDAPDGGNFPGVNNPALPGLNADPQIALFDGVYYIYPTTDGFPNWGSPSFSTFSSTNLVQWMNRGVILDLPTGLTWAVDRAWAPSIARVDSTYFFYFCAALRIGVATSTSPTGPFQDALGHPMIDTNQYGTQSIDPYVFLDDDGAAYLYFGSGPGGLRMAKLDSSMLSLSEAPSNISPANATGVLEGSVMFKRNQDYYLQWSEGDTRLASYQVAYARAKSPRGPFTRIGPIPQQDASLRILATGGTPFSPSPRETNTTWFTIASRSMAVTERTAKPVSTGCTSTVTAPSFQSRRRWKACRPVYFHEGTPKDQSLRFEETRSRCRTLEVVARVDEIDLQAQVAGQRNRLGTRQRQLVSHRRRRQARWSRLALRGDRARARPATDYLSSEVRPRQRSMVRASRTKRTRTSQCEPPALPVWLQASRDGAH